MDLYLLSGVLNDKVEVIEDTEDGIKYYTKSPSNELQAEPKS